MSEIALKGLMKIAGLVVLSTIFISTFSILGTSSYQTVFGEKTFPKNSLIGSVSVSGMQPAEAKEQIDKEAGAWKSSQSLSLQHNSESISLPGGLWTFQTNETVDAMTSNDATEVPLSVTVNTEQLAELISEMGVSADLFNLPLLSEVLTGYASTFENDDISIDLANYYMTANEVEKIAQSKVKGDSELILVPNLAHTIENVTIEPEQTFSLQELLREESVTEKATESLNLFSSSIMEVLLHSNFELKERHTTLDLPKYGELGLNASINMTNQDFSFYNPNQSSYHIEFKWEKDHLIVTLYGPPFPLTYQPSVEKEKLSPDTIIQYSEALSGSEKTIIQEGKPGYLITTFRETLDQDDRLIKKEKMVEDFYSPVHRIEKKAYPEPPAVKETEGTPSDGGDSSESEKENGNDTDEKSSVDEDGNPIVGDKSDETPENQGGKGNEDEVIKGLEYQKEEE